MGRPFVLQAQPARPVDAERILQRMQSEWSSKQRSARPPGAPAPKEDLVAHSLVIEAYACKAQPALPHDAERVLKNMARRPLLPPLL